MHAQVAVRLLTPDDPALAVAQAAVELGFAAGGTARGALGARERDAEASDPAGWRSCAASWAPGIS